MAPAPSTTFVLNGLQLEEPGAKGPDPVTYPEDDGFYEGTVFRTFLNAVFVQFTKDETVFLARMCPPKMYINGRRNLLNHVNTLPMMRAFLPQGSKVRITVADADEKEELIFINDPTDKKESQKVLKKDGRRLDGEKRALKVGTDRSDRFINYVVVQMWNVESERQTSATELEMSHTGDSFQQEENSMDELILKLQLNELDEHKLVSEDLSKARWFLTHHMGAKPRSKLAWPKEAEDCEKVEGTVVTLMRPHGGILKTSSGDLVYFHRSRVLIDGCRTGYTEVLEDFIQVGAAVRAMVIDNKKKIGQDIYPLVDHCPCEKVAFWVQVGKEAEKLPQRIPMNLIDKFRNSHRLRIMEIIQGDDGMFRFGVAMIMTSPLTVFGNESSMVGKFVYFDSKHMSYCGFPMEDISLNWFATVALEINCQLEKLKPAEKEAVDSKCSYKCTFRVSDGSFLRAGKENTKVGDLPDIMPGSMSAQWNIQKRGFSIEQMESMLYRHKCPFPTPPAGFAPAVISGLNLPKEATLETPVNEGTAMITDGEYKNRTVTFKSSNLQAFGYNLAKGDLSYLVYPYDRVYVDTSCFGGMNDEKGDQPQAERIILGNPTVTTKVAREMTERQRLDFIIWLQSHNVTMERFLKAILSETPVRPFVPFFRELMQGRVLRLFTGESPENHQGSTPGGLVVIENGFAEIENPVGLDKGMVNMTGKEAVFDKDHFWIFGREASKADLAYVIPHRQKILLEAVPIVPGETNVLAQMPPHIKWKASLAWVGPARPRNDKELDPGRNDEGIYDWLLKRNLDMKSFAELVEGKLTPKPNSAKDDNGFAVHVEEYQDKMDRKGPARHPRDFSPQPLLQMPVNFNSLPVLQHGEDVALMLDSAISASGPNDFQLKNLIQNDAMAQRAYHIAEALKYGIEHYKKKKQEGSFHQGFGSFQGRDGSSSSRPFGARGNGQQGGSFGNSRQPMPLMSQDFGYGQQGGYGNSGGGYGQKRPSEGFGGGYQRSNKRQSGGAYGQGSGSLNSWYN